MSDKLHQVKSYLHHFFTASRKGHGVHSPFAYGLCEEVFYNKNSFYDFEVLEKMRKKLLRDERKIKVEDLGAGSSVLHSGERRICDIARHGISGRKEAEILFKLVNYLNSEMIYELGTSLGLMTAYFAKANKNAAVFSMEGSRELVKVANEVLKELNVNNYSITQGNFDVEFPKIIALIKKSETAKLPNLFYFDGNHTYEATLRYFQMAKTLLHQHTVMVLDDIYWSKGMTKAWKEIEEDTAVTLSIDCFQFGLVFFRPELKEKTKLRFLI